MGDAGRSLTDAVGRGRPSIAAHVFSDAVGRLRGALADPHAYQYSAGRQVAALELAQEVEGAAPGDFAGRNRSRSTFAGTTSCTWRSDFALLNALLARVDQARAWHDSLAFRAFHPHLLLVPADRNPQSHVLELGSRIAARDLGDLGVPRPSDLDALVTATDLHLGAAGLNRLLSQFIDANAPLEVPLTGAMDPSRWHAATPRGRRQR